MASSKRTIKQKLDDSVLQKARTALGLPAEDPEEDPSPAEKNAEPSLKWRKPRHNTAEGQVYVKNKQKRKLEHAESNPPPPAKSPKNESKRRKKNKKKKKTEGAEGAIVGKNPEGELKHSMEAISYMQLWSSNRDHWKFEKRKQTWLLKNCLNEKLMDDNRFEVFLEYVATVKGAARQSTLVEMKKFVEKYESDESNSGNDVSYSRARQIVQMIT